MPQDIFVSNPDDMTKRVKPNTDGSVNVNTGTVTIAQPVQTITSTPASSDLRAGSANATGTLITIPAGRTFFGSISLAASVSVLGNGNPSVSSANTGGGTGATTGTLHQIVVAGLALSAAANGNTIDNVYIYGGTNGATVTFTQGASGQSCGQISGRLL